MKNKAPKKPSSWARVVYEALESAPEDEDFEAFRARNPQLFDSRYVGRFYSRGVLFGERARQEWVEPDLCELPAREG